MGRIEQAARLPQESEGGEWIMVCAGVVRASTHGARKR
ncbi:hypothetical protein HD596_000516 [Nonomuraea jabiensis]|uniref:Uncharacterized protein n=1 Tax=Nonomuraea jabiensis TaxID=882448 RepID=A0A7W9FY90_9ACTN|nr:hypothetical protein [Nonomuraea jabiensis]